MIIATTQTIGGKQIRETRGIVFGEVVKAVNFARNFSASLTRFTGGHVTEFEQELADVRAHAIGIMMQRAADLGANAVVAVDFDYMMEDGMMFVSANGTAVVTD